MLLLLPENEFENLYLSISESFGEKKEGQGMYGSAIEYYMQAKQLAKVERIIDRILESYWNEGQSLRCVVCVRFLLMIKNSFLHCCCLKGN